MPRSARIVIDDEEAVYYVMTSTALDGFPFGDVEKDNFVDLFKRLSGIYFTEVSGVLRDGQPFSFPGADDGGEYRLREGEIKQRFEQLLWQRRETLLVGQIPMLRQKWCSISEYCKGDKAELYPELTCPQ